MRLAWKAPTRNEDGSSESVDLAKARVMRRVIEIPAVPPAPVEEASQESEPPSAAPAPAPAPPFRSEAVVVEEVASWKLGETRLHEEPIDSAWLGKRLEYAVVYENGKGRESPLSEIVRLDPAAPLSPPTSPKAESGDGFVALSWSPPQDAREDLAFSVRRRLGDAKDYPDLSLNAEPLAVPSFEDRTAVFGARSCYVVEAVLSPPGSISSLPSEEVCITPEDRFPPEAPSGLVAVPSGEAVLLSWREVEAKDRKGYRVYRGASPEGPFEFLGEVTETRFADETMGAGESYFYFVTAIDDAPGTNESARSEVVEARRSPGDEPGR